MADKISFGVYELDRDARELRKRGVLIRLQDQPFRVLAILTAHPGEIVTREKLQQQIWGQETFVDFDQSLNKAVNRIREALDDSAGTPRYIETVPRRGYRFIAPVEGEKLESQPRQPVATAATDIENPARPQWKILLPIASILIAVLMFAVWLLRPTPQPQIVKSTRLTNNGLVKCCLVTDGSQVYFSQTDPNTNSLRLEHVPVTGGDPSEIHVPGQNGQHLILDISPTHDRLLVAAPISAVEYSFWSVSLGAESPRPLLDVPVGSDFYGSRWSPDGTKLAFAKGFNLYLAQSDGSEPKIVYVSKGPVLSPVWSPDGKWLRFVASESPNSNASTLLEVSTSGGKSREVTPRWQNKSSECAGNWTPDGRYFVFLTGCNGRTDIWAIREKEPFLNFQKNEPVLLYAGPIQYGDFAFSPDGKKIFIEGRELRGESDRYDRKSGQFVPFSPGLSADCCVYSKDGQWLAYVTFPEQTLWRSRTDGSQRQQLTWPPMNALNPHWSPDGKEIAFSALLPGKPLKTFIIAAQGGKARMLTQTNCAELDANWSPDGTHMIFGGLFILSSAPCSNFLRLVDLKTHEVSDVPGSEGLWSPRWSPDGRKIVAMSTNMHVLMIGEVETGKWSELLRLSPDIFEFPQWSTDGRLVYYWESVKNAFYSVSVEGKKIEKLAAVSGIPITGNEGQWAAVTPDGSPLILRDLSLNEIYALDFAAP